MTKEILVRKALLDDINNIVDLWWVLMSEHQKRDDFYWANADEKKARLIYDKFLRDCFVSKDNFLFMAITDDEVSGFIHGVIIDKAPVYELSRAGRVNEIVVSPSHRKKGVARVLLSGLEDEFKKQGLLVMDLMVDIDNPGALALYRSFGMYTREYHMIKKL